MEITTIDNPVNYKTPKKINNKILDLDDLLVHPYAFRDYNKEIGKLLIVDREDSDKTSIEYVYNKMNKNFSSFSKKDAMNINLKYTDFLRQKNIKGFNPMLDEGLSEKYKKLSELKINCNKFGLNIEKEIQEINNYIEKREEYSLEGIINLAKNLENNIFLYLFKNKEYKEDLLKSIVEKNNFLLNRKYVSENPTSYRNIKFKKLKKAFPKIYSNSLKTIMYEALSIKKPNVKLPAWFEKAYLPLLNYISDIDVFTTKDFYHLITLKTIDSSLVKGFEKMDNKEIETEFKKKRLYLTQKALKEAVNLGLIEKTGIKGKYKVIKKPKEFFKNRNKRDDFEEINPNISKIIADLGISSDQFQDGYAHFVRKQIFTDEINELINKYDEDDVDLKLFNNKKSVHEAFYKIKTENNLINLMKHSPISYNMMDEKIKYTQELINDFAKSLLIIQKNPKKGLKFFNKSKKKYTKIIYSL